MTTDLTTSVQTETERPVEPGPRRHGPLSFRRSSAAYILVVLLVVFSIVTPETFLTSSTWSSLIDTQALTALAAIGLLIPVAAGAFDLAVAAQVGFGTILVSWLLMHAGMPPWIAVPVTIAIGAALGLASGIAITIFRIDSFIATLGMSSVAAALTSWLSDGSQILNLPIGFASFATQKFLGLTNSVWIMLLVAVVVWYVLEKTPVGRRIYATGGNATAARLAGVRTSLVLVGSLVACGAITALVGVLLASRLGTGDPTIGGSYLLPAFSAVFLGSTQFKFGRFNVWGTVVAVYVLAVGVTGLQLAGAPFWIPGLFNGIALLLAVGLASTAGAGGPAGLRRLLNGVRRGRGGSD
ncbi:ABC transporter permease [Rhodococcus sp. NPDC057529]|uniref:ABC transporter permease n=1 Tax=Rhodococcus sp. NPDC057529 TaxID=3346158 RepID=UPI00366C2607